MGGNGEVYRNTQFQFTQINPNLKSPHLHNTLVRKPTGKYRNVKLLYALPCRHVCCILISETKNILADKSHLPETCSDTAAYFTLFIYLFSRLLFCMGVKLGR